MKPLNDVQKEIRNFLILVGSDIMFVLNLGLYDFLENEKRNEK